MYTEFIARVASQLKATGYQVEIDPGLPGLSGLLYARSQKRFRLGFAKVEEHFLFMDWENTVFGRLDQALEVYKRFNGLVNQGFTTPHLLRMQIPSMALALISGAGFPEQARQYVRSNSLVPFKGGETGQILLIDLAGQEVTHWIAPRMSRYPAPGELPLSHAADILRDACQKAFCAPAGVSAGR